MSFHHNVIQNEHVARLSEVCQSHGVRMVVLFGSRATNKPPPAQDSDIDLAVLLPGADFMACHQALCTPIAEIFPQYAVDLVLLQAADPLFRYEIMRVGRLLYGDIDDFLEYKAFAYRDFTDSADLRALEDVLFRKKMASIRKSLYAPA